MVLFRGAETHTRSVLKALSWRTLEMLDTFAISWFLTGRVAIAGSIAALEVITKIAWYYVHERIWAAVPGAGVTDWTSSRERFRLPWFAARWRPGEPTGQFKQKYDASFNRGGSQTRDRAALRDHAISSSEVTLTG